MAERYQVRGRRIWDSETDTYSMLFCEKKTADYWMERLNSNTCVISDEIIWKRLDQWDDNEPVEQPASDPVNNPPHYTQGGIQCDDAIRAMLGPEGYSAYVRGTMLAYMWRLPHKGQAVLDAGKVRRYSDWLVEIVNKIYG